MSLGQALVAIGRSKVDPTKSLAQQGAAASQAIINIGKLQAQTMGTVAKQFSDMTNQAIKNREATYKALETEYQKSRENLIKAGATGYKSGYLNEYALSKRNEIKEKMLEIQNTSAYDKAKIRTLKTEVSSLVNEIETTSNDILSSYEMFNKIGEDIDKGDVYKFEAKQLYNQLSNPNTAPLNNVDLNTVMRDFRLPNDLTLKYYNDNLRKLMDDGAYTIDANGKRIRNNDMPNKIIANFNDTPEGQSGRDYYRSTLISGQQKTYQGINDVGTILRGIDQNNILDAEDPANEAGLAKIEELRSVMKTKLKGQFSDEDMLQILQNPQIIALADESIQSLVSEEVQEISRIKGELNINMVDVGDIYNLMSDDGDSNAETRQMAAGFLGLIYNEQYEKGAVGQNNIPQLITFLKENENRLGGSAAVDNTIAHIMQEVDRTLDDSLIEYAYNRTSNNSFKNAKKDFDTKRYRAARLAQGSGGSDVSLELNPQDITLNNQNFKVEYIESPKSASKIATPTFDVMNPDTRQVIGETELSEYVFYDGGYAIGNVDNKGYLMQSPIGTMEPIPGLTSQEQYGANRIVRGIEKSRLQDLLQDNPDVDLAQLLKKEATVFVANTQNYDRFGKPSARETKFFNEYERLVSNLNQGNNNVDENQNPIIQTKQGPARLNSVTGKYELINE